jgi:hypothetical protein
VRYLASIREIRNAHKRLGLKDEGNRAFWRPTRIMVAAIKTEEKGYELCGLDSVSSG